MTSSNTYLAVFLGSADSSRVAAFHALPDEERTAKARDGIAAWKRWMQIHRDSIVGEGGPLGKTKRVTAAGIEDIRNLMGGFTIVRAESHDAAAAMFKDHPHFMIFPGEAVEIMPVLPIPEG